MTRARIVHRIFLLACTLLLAACASFPVNPPLVRYDENAGYRFDRLAAGADSDDLFVILVFSGGGTRAAALSYGVLEALRDTAIHTNTRKTSLLDEVDVISAISGGSFPAAYYGLYGARTFDEFPGKFLYRPIQSDLMKTALMPQNLLRLTGSSFGRSDLAAEFYDREVFGGATYADLIAQHHRPFVILNATDMTSGAQFPFIQDQFDPMCADLAGITLGRAAAASSAFPGGLTPLTFKNYAGQCQYREPEWVKNAIKDRSGGDNPGATARADNLRALADGKRAYIHLTDGGVADNIGLRGPLAALTSTSEAWSVLQLMNEKKISKLVVIVVNAATNPANSRDSTPKVPGLIDTLTTAATVPLGNYSFDTLEQLSSAVDEFNQEDNMREGCKRLAAEKGPQCTLDIPAPHKVELFPVQIAFDFLDSPGERTWFKNLPTTLELPRETVDKLRAAGRKLLSENEEFKALMEGVGGCLPEAQKSCTDR